MIRASFIGDPVKLQGVTGALCGLLLGCVSSRYKSPRAITVAINLASLIQFVLRRKSSSLFEQIEQNFDQHLSWSFWSPKLPRLAYALTPVVPNKLELQYSEATGSVKGHIRTEKDTRKRVT